MAKTGGPHESDPSDDFTGGKLFDRVFAEGMALVEEAAAYLDGPGRTDAKSLSREAGLTYAAWSMELTTRLMQAASWLVMQKAVRDGDMEPSEAMAEKYRMVREGEALDASAQRKSGMPDQFLDLVENAEALFDRICRIDDSLYGPGRGASPGAESPVSEQIARLQRAAERGVFDPLSIWRKAR